MMTSPQLRESPDATKRQTSLPGISSPGRRMGAEPIVGFLSPQRQVQLTVSAKAPSTRFAANTFHGDLIRCPFSLELMYPKHAPDTGCPERVRPGSPNS